MLQSICEEDVLRVSAAVVALLGMHSGLVCIQAKPLEVQTDLGTLPGHRSTQ
jgi:hypothetical protein